MGWVGSGRHARLANYLPSRGDFTGEAAGWAAFAPAVTPAILSFEAEA